MARRPRRRDFFLRLLRAQQRFRARTKPIRGRNCRRPTSAGRVGTPLINREGLHSSAPDHHGSLLDRRVPPPPPPRLEASRRRARSRWRETPRNRGAGGAIPEAARTNGRALAIRRVRGTRGTMLPPRGAPPNETERASDQPPPPQSRPRRRASSGAAASRPPPPLQLHAPAACARARMRNLCSPLAFLPLHARMFLMFEDKAAFRGMDIRVSGWKGDFLERERGWLVKILGE